VTKTSPQITIFTGRFGSGKTEIALNYAVALSKRGLDPYLIDLDIVTPYFRTRDRAAEMAGLGVQVVSPFLAGHYLHIPAINPQILGTIEQGHRLVEQASQQLGLPIAFAVVSKALSEQLGREQLGVELVVIHRYFLMLDAAEARNEAGSEGLS